MVTDMCTEDNRTGILYTAAGTDKSESLLALVPAVIMYPSYTAAWTAQGSFDLSSVMGGNH